MKKLLSITLSIIMLISAMAFIAPTPARAETLAQTTTMRALRADELSPYVDATTALSHGHVARVYAEEDLNTIVYRNTDGTKTAYFFDYNVKYVDENGQTQDKDITLATKAGGFGLTQSDISLTIPTDITNGVEFTHNGNYIKLTPLRESIIEESLSSSVAALNKPQSAVKDTVKNEISYQKAFGNNTSLRYVPTMEGIKEEIILSAYNGTTAWRFLATTNGLTPYKDASGIYYFATTEDSDERYSLGDVYTYDSVGNYTYGTMEVVEVKPAQQYIITLNVDEEFLTADSTVYPVYVDPTITVPSEGLYDTTVYSNYATPPYGIDPELQIGRYVENTTDYGIARVALKAQNLINNGTFYYNMDNIISATLMLHFKSVASGKSVSIYRGTNFNWTESDATWNTVGNSYSTLLKTFTPDAGLNYIDVTSIVTGWKANENNLRGGLLLRNSDETNATSCHTLYSNENTNSLLKPTLVIIYQDYETFSTYSATMNSLQTLYNIALGYDSNPRNATLLTLQFIRRGKYNGGNWNVVAGTINTDFVDYVADINLSIYNIFTIESHEDYYMSDPTGGGYIDFPHFCATLNGLFYDSTSFKSIVAGEETVDDLCGWAGDLQTLCRSVLHNTNESNEYSIVYNETYRIMGLSYYNFSMADLLADTDAFNIYNSLDGSISNIMNTISTYYENNSIQRFSLFVGNRSKTQLYTDVRRYTNDETPYLLYEWPLLESVEITNNQANAMASAFTDYIWERIEDE